MRSTQALGVILTVFLALIAQCHISAAQALVTQRGTETIESYDSATEVLTIRVLYSYQWPVGPARSFTVEPNLIGNPSFSPSACTYTPQNRTIRCPSSITSFSISYRYRLQINATEDGKEEFTYQSTFARQSSSTNGTYDLIYPPSWTFDEERVSPEPTVADPGLFRWEPQNTRSFVAQVRFQATDCSKQVEVTEFRADVEKGLRVDIQEGYIFSDTIDLLTKSYSGPGIKFTAKVRINDAPLRANTIHIRYIQNLTKWQGTIWYDPPPNLIATLKDGESYPLVDWSESCSSIPPFPYYNCNFEETNPTGTERTITAEDSPHVKVWHPRPLVGRIPSPLLEDLEAVDITEEFTTYLGCYTDANPVFRTLRTLDWKAYFVGTFEEDLPKFTPSGNAGIVAQDSIPSGKKPKDTGLPAIDVIDRVTEPD